MRSCLWCGTSRRCPDCKKAAALRGGVAASGDKAPESTVKKIDETGTRPTVPASPRPPRPRLEGHDHPAPASAGAYAQGCRHPDCRAANTAYRNAQRRKAGAQIRQHRGHTHGRASTYNRGCRCEPCRVAHAEAVRRFRAAKARPEAPTVPSKAPKASPMGDDSGQIDAQDGKMGK